MIRRERLLPFPLLPGIFMAAAFGLPLLAVLGRLIGSGGGGEVLRSAYYRGVLVFTLKQAALSTIFSVLFGLPGAYLVGRCRFPGRRILKSLSTVPFVLPPLLAVLGFVLIFGSNGLINGLRRLLFGPGPPPLRILYSLPAIVMAHVFYNFPLTLRIVGDSWAALPLADRRSASVLGAGRFRAFFYTDLPRLLPAVLTAGTLTFLYCFMSFAVVLVLGGGPELSTLEVEIYRLITQQLDFGRGSILAAAESIIALSLLAAYAASEALSRRHLVEDPRSLPRREPVTPAGWNRLWIFAYLGIALLLVPAPLAAVAANSFLVRGTPYGGPGFSLQHWARLFGETPAGTAPAMPAILRTMVLALSSAATASAAAAAAAWHTVRNRGWTGFTEMMLALPLGVSSIVLGLGWLLLLRYFPSGDLPRILALGASHALIALPFSYRIILGRLRELSPRISQAAAAAGASPMRTLLRVEIPLARKAVITAAVFAFALSAGELNAAAILAPGNFTTIPLAIYRLIGAYNFGSACALGTVLIAVTAVAFAILDRWAGE